MSEPESVAVSGSSPAVGSVDLDAIEARADAATPGPWATVRSDDGTFYGQPPTYDVLAPVGGRDEPVACGGCVEDGGPSLGASGHADAEFIAHAREDVPALLAEVRRLASELAGVRVKVERVFSASEGWARVLAAVQAERDAAIREATRARAAPARVEDALKTNHMRFRLSGLSADGFAIHAAVVAALSVAATDTEETP